MRQHRLWILALNGGLVLVGPARTWAQCEVAELRAPDPEPADWFGLSVAISGDVVAVGAPGDDDASPDMHCNSGAVYVYRRNGGAWVEEDTLTASDAACGDRFGRRVSVSGDYLAVGTSGPMVYVFEHNGSGWVERAKVFASATESNTAFGESISINEEYLVVGAPYSGSAGEGLTSAYLFRRVGSDWVEEQRLFPSEAQGWDAFGHSVAINGNLVVVGAPFDDGVDPGTYWCDSGAAYVFQRDGQDWVTKAKLTPVVTSCGTRFGRGPYGVAVGGDHVFVQATSSLGSVYVFREEGTSWLEIAKFSGSDARDPNVFGVPVSADGRYAVVGERTYGGIGAAYVFGRVGTTWVEESRLIASDGAQGDTFAYSCVSIDGDYVVAGAPNHDDFAGNSGAVYVYRVLGEPDCDGDGINDACDADCNGNGAPDSCDIADGTSQDCNNNGIPDECEPGDCNKNGIADICDIADGESDDCDTNGIPDECEPDCNTNGVADACDIADGTSGDCNDNAIPDDCDIAEGRSQDCNDDGIPDDCGSDCNSNGVLDECEPDEDCNNDGILDFCEIVARPSLDCNNNGMHDTCDIQSGASQDSDGNGVPDECAGSARMFFVPAGDDPREYDAGPTVIDINPYWVQSGNVTVTLEVFLENTAPAAVWGYGFSIGHATGGNAGSADLQGVHGTWGEITPNIDVDRADFIFADVDSYACAVDPDYPVRFACGFTESENAVAVIDPVYLGEITYRFSADAAGEFYIDFVSLGDSTGVTGPAEPPEDYTPLDFIPGFAILNVVAASCETDMDCYDGAACTADRCDDGLCDNTPRTYGDVNDNGSVDLGDILCVLDGFAGIFDNCTLQDVDISPCLGDGVIELVEILNVLDIFSHGPNPCPIQCR